MHLPRAPRRGNPSASWPVAPGAAPALAAALRELQHDSVKRTTLGQAGARALRERFGIEPVAAAIADLYRQLTDGGKP